mgnify:FL=1
MKNRILATTLAILLCLSLAACSGAPAEESPAPDETAAPSPTPAPSAEPEETQAPPPEDLRISVLLQPKSELRDSEGSLVFLGYYSEPVVTVSASSTASYRISSALASRLAKGGAQADEIFEQAEDEFKTLSEEERALFLPRSLTRTASVERGDGAVLSLLCVDYAYTGGSHGKGDYVGMCFNTMTGTKLALSDIFTDTGALGAKAAEAVEAQAAAMDESEGFSGLREFVDSALEGGHWYLNNEGLALVASEGEIAPESDGSFTFVLPYAELEGLIKPEYVPASAPEGASGAEDFELSDEPGSEPVYSITLDQEAPAFYLSAKADTAPFALCSVTLGGSFYYAYDDDGEGSDFERLRDYLWISGLEAGECVEIGAWFMDMPTMGLSFGPEKELLLFWQSGEDGSLFVNAA